MKHISFIRIVELYLVLTLGAIILVMNSPFLYQHLIVIPINFDVGLMIAPLKIIINTPFPSISQFVTLLNDPITFSFIAACMMAMISYLLLVISTIRALRIR